MYDAETLLDIHHRAHESLRRLIAFCGVLRAEELVRPVAGFGFPTILRQLEHTIGAEVYWQTVVTTGYSEEAELRPADVIMRIVTHIFNHQGQVLAMCRAMGKANEERDLDYPVD